jgi:uncharacterized protein (TIGR03663 family)
MTRAQKAWGTGVVAAAALMRLAALGSRFFHSDEAIHAWMSHQLAAGAGYHVDPVYHGPLLYHLQALVFTVAGAGDVQARLIPALAGVLLVAVLCVWLRTRVGSVAALTAGSLALVSPSLTYYSRFDSHDSLIALFTVVMLTASFDCGGAGLFWLAAAGAMAIATKVNAYFVIGTLALYLMARTAYGVRRRRPIAPVRFALDHRGHIARAFAIAAAVIAILSITTITFNARNAGSVTPGGVVTALRSVTIGGVEYWWSIHQAPRLGGPNYYYLPLLAIYEPIVLFGAPIALFWFMRRRARAAVMVAVLAASAWLGSGSWFAGLVVGWIAAGGWTVFSLWEDGREFLACWVFAGLLQLLLYSWANEKVPWLLVHIVLPWFVVIAAFLADVWASTPRPATRTVLVAAVVVIELFTARASWIVNTRNRNNVAEPMLQLDYTAAVEEATQRIQALPQRTDQPLHISIEPNVQWPFGWYFRDLRVDYWSGPIPKVSDEDAVVTEDHALPAAYADRYTGGAIPYLHWTSWIENVRRGDWRGLLRFALWHDTWGDEAHTTLGVWTRK